MAERSKLLYIIINDEGKDVGHEQGKIEARKVPPPRYTRSVLQSTVQLMGCNPRHSLKITDRVFEVFSSDIAVEEAKACYQLEQTVEDEPGVEPGCAFSDRGQVDGSTQGSTMCNLCEKRASVTVERERFLDVVCDGLARYQYVGPNRRADLKLACRVREKKMSVTVLLCGTSGCGKSTLASLLASRLGINTVVSTDSVRHMMRSFASQKENPLLWASTYSAGECLTEVKPSSNSKEAKGTSTTLSGRSSTGVSRSSGSVGSTKGSQGSSVAFLEKKDDGQLEGQSFNGNRLGTAEDNDRGKSEMPIENTGSTVTGASEGVAESILGSKTLVVQGFKAQSEMVIDSLDRLITSWEKRNESVVVEGVHLSLNFVMGLMKKHPSIVPFMVYISNEEKHLERFAVRAKYMTLDPAKNKYVKYIRNIRTIQEYICKRADKHLVPKLNNTNVDKSIALIHATIFSCLRRLVGGEPLWDQATNTVKVVDQEYRSQYAASSLGSKGMFQLIQRKGSSRHLMALMNTDGSVAKAWPILSEADGNASGSSNVSEKGAGTSVSGPLVIGKAEPVNLQFGNFGLSAWLTESDTGTASYAASSNSSGDAHSLRGDNDSQPNCMFPRSFSGSPKQGEGGEKELSMESEVVASGSDEEPDEGEPREVDSDGEASDSGAEQVDFEEGSVDDQTERSDEDVEDFETRHRDDGSWPDSTLEGNTQERSAYGLRLDHTLEGALEGANQGRSPHTAGRRW